MTDENETSLVLAMLTRLDGSITALRAEVGQRFDSLGERFVPRPEINTRFDESAKDRRELRIELVKLTDKVEQHERQRAVDRRWTIGTAVGLLAAIPGVVELITKR